MRFKEWLKLREATPARLYMDRPAPAQPQQQAPAAIPLNKNPNGNLFIDPETGVDYSGANPYYDNDTGAILDARKAKEWDVRKKKVEELNRELHTKGAENAAASKERMSNAEREFNDLIDKTADGLISNQVMPFQHPAFVSRFNDIISRNGITGDERAKMLQNASGKLRYIMTSIRDPERRQSHMANQQKQFGKKIGTVPLNA